LEEKLAILSLESIRHNADKSFHYSKRRKKKTLRRIWEIKITRQIIDDLEKWMMSPQTVHSMSFHIFLRYDGTGESDEKK
jgi:hypothetical protein